jgi:hypothetical protein
MKRIFSISMLILVLASCQKNTSSIKKYYFPYAGFIQPKIYQYADGKDSSLTMYWHFKTEVNSTDTLLTTSFYNSRFELTHIFQNKMSTEGCKLVKMFVTSGDSAKMQECEIKKDEVFAWNQKIKQSLFLSYRVNYPDPAIFDEIVTERNLIEKKELLNFNNKEYECILIKDATLINHISTNRTQTEEQERTSYFAEGLGLIKMETFNAKGANTLFVLKKIFTEDEWNQLRNPPVKINSEPLQ